MKVWFVSLLLFTNCAAHHPTRPPTPRQVIFAAYSIQRLEQKLAGYCNSEVQSAWVDYLRAHEEWERLKVVEISKLRVGDRVVDMRTREARRAMIEAKRRMTSRLRELLAIDAELTQALDAMP